MIDGFKPLEAYASTYAALVEATPGCRVVPVGRPGSLSCTVTPFPFAAFNRVMTVRLAEDEVEAAIGMAMAAHGAAGVPGSWWLDSETTPAGIERALERHGYRREAAAPAMVRGLDDLPDSKPMPGVELSFVRGREPMRQVQRLIALGFGRPPAIAEMMAEVVAPLGDEPETPIRVVVASLDGVPVASATSITVGEVCGVFTVATLPEARGKGLGGATTLAVLRDARDRGARVGVLHASELGFGVYARMGFRHAGDFDRFVSGADG